MVDEPTDKTLVRGSDPDPASPNHAPVKTTEEARAGVELGRMRWVLHISVALVALGFLAAWLLTR